MKTLIQQAIDTIKEYRDSGGSNVDTCNTILLIYLVSMLEKEDDVSKQSELLKDFRKWWNEDNQGVCTTITHKDIERYLESL